VNRGGVDVARFSSRTSLPAAVRRDLRLAPDRAASGTSREIGLSGQRPCRIFEVLARHGEWVWLTGHRRERASHVMQIGFDVGGGGGAWAVG